MTRWCDNCKNRENCEKYKEEMQLPSAWLFLGCLGGYEEKKDCKTCKYGCNDNVSVSSKCIRCDSQYNEYERNSVK